MERVTFEVAKAIKEAGYPQDKFEYDEGYAISEVYYEVYSSRDDRWHSSSAVAGRLLSFDDDYYYPKDCGEFCVAPSYMETWLWLWREKKIYIGLEAESYPHDGMCVPDYIDAPYSDPEEAIKQAIDYLVEHNLIDDKKPKKPFPNIKWEDEPNN